MSFTLCPDQVQASHSFQDFLSDSTKQVWRLSGSAGTGKSSLVLHLLSSSGLKPFDRFAFMAERGNQPDSFICCAPTRRAAGVLLRTGVRGACTIHAAAYSPMLNLSEEDRERIKALGREVELAEREAIRLSGELGEDDPKAIAAASHAIRLAGELEKLEEPSFEFSADMIEATNLLILDEASMISQKIWKDLLSADARIVAIGDAYQLPPVEAAA